MATSEANKLLSQLGHFTYLATLPKHTFRAWLDRANPIKQNDLQAIVQLIKSSPAHLRICDRLIANEVAWQTALSIDHPEADVIIAEIKEKLLK